MNLFSECLYFCIKRPDKYMSGKSDMGFLSSKNPVSYVISVIAPDNLGYKTEQIVLSFFTGEAT